MTRVWISCKMNPMAVLQLYPKKSLSIFKIAAVIVGASAAVAAAAQFAVPYSIMAVPRLWSPIRFFLTPPCLFITVHLIIVAIWKLSDQKHPKHPNDRPADGAEPLDRNVTPSKAATMEMPAESDAVTPVSDSKTVESCVTTDSDKNSAVSSGFQAKASKDAEMDLEDTWQALVMKKSATWEISSDAAAEVAGELPVRGSVTFGDAPAPAAGGNDELNRRFEEFIKKNYDQMRCY